MKAYFNIKPNLPSPIQKLNIKGSNQYWIKRDDLIHPHISGNKWRKLFFQLHHHIDVKGIVTFGGAFSNHILATATYSSLNKLDSIGFIRTDIIDQSNPTLKLAQSYGMTLVALDRNEYRQKNDLAFLQKIKQSYPDYLIIPEGGSNQQALKGYDDFWKEINEQTKTKFDIICSSWGTGSTASGIMKNINEETEFFIFPAIKGLNNENVAKTISDNSVKQALNYQLFQTYALKGYGKINRSIMEFASNFYQEHDILLDPIYTVKMMIGILDLQQEGIVTDKNILIYHSGGNQGWAGVFYRNPKYIEEYSILYNAFKAILL